MAANVEYNEQKKDAVDLSHVPILGNYAPLSDSEIAYVRWYSATGTLRQFYGVQPAEQIQAIAAFETIQSDAGWLRQLTLPVDYNGRMIGYLQVAILLTEARDELQELLTVMVIAVPCHSRRN
jgi:hypothetical protein